MNITFQDQRRALKITMQQLAEVAGVSDKEVYFFEIGVLMDPEKKEKIVAAFSRLTGHPYQLSDFEYQPQKPLPASPFPRREEKSI